MLVIVDEVKASEPVSLKIVAARACAVPDGLCGRGCRAHLPQGLALGIPALPGRHPDDPDGQVSDPSRAGPDVLGVAPLVGDGREAGGRAFPRGVACRQGCEVIGLDRVEDASTAGRIAVQCQRAGRPVMTRQGRRSRSGDDSAQRGGFALN